MNFSAFTVCAISYLQIGARAAPFTGRGDIPVEVTEGTKMYLLPKTLMLNDHINVTGKISNTTFWWWNVSLLKENKDSACDIKGDRITDTVTINSKIEEYTNASAVFADFKLIIRFIIKDGDKIAIILNEDLPVQHCNLKQHELGQIMFIKLDGNIEKVDELHFKLA